MDKFDEKFIGDLRALAKDTEKLLAATSGQTGAEILKLRDRLEDTLQSVQSKIAGVERGLVDQAKAAAKTTDRYVHDNTWASIGVASLIGLLAGVAIGRR
jgi:ElaB/YqjD/DUF883 family membrane-anchored ribosome-binding protein